MPRDLTSFYESGLLEQFRNDLDNGRVSKDDVKRLLTENNLSDAQLTILCEQGYNTLVQQQQQQRPVLKPAAMPQGQNARPSVGQQQQGAQRVGILRRVASLQKKVAQQPNNQVLNQGMMAINQWLDYMESKTGTSTNVPQQTTLQ